MFLRFCFTFFFLLSTIVHAFAQLNIDSLKAELSESPRDSNRVKTLNRLAWNLRSINPEQAMGYALESEKLAQEIHFDKGRGDAFNSIGVLHYRRGEYPEAVKAHLQALTIRENIGDKEGMALSYINLGNVYSDQPDDKAAISNYLLAASLLNESGNIEKLSFVYLNIGAVFLAENKFAEAIPYCEKAKISAQKNKDKTVEAEAVNNEGVAYEGLLRYDDALKQYEASFVISQETGDKTEMSDNMTNIGNMYRQKKDFVQALDWHKRSEKLARENSYLEGLRVLYEDFSHDYEAMGDYKTALEYHVHFKALSDSLFNEENETKINSLMDKWESDRNAKELIVQQETLRAQEEDKRAGEQRMWIMASGGIIIFLFLAYVVYTNSRIKKAKLLLQAQNTEMIRLKENIRAAKERG
jgi:tetratricopeptide (TPR) repeat protein